MDVIKRQPEQTVERCVKPQDSARQTTRRQMVALMVTPRCVFTQMKAKPPYLHRRLTDSALGRGKRRLM
ncbi:hypothetical protein Baya_16324 [Bagarius yarrelli]|uniref:Uncharacterized protein n=1 Tax=Bagarius yarrelli TaxID=175774 RepID=A0A556VV19_BAGYA|nr:hypothetical protein Baya_16324 [Bagarius yarrelli]